MFACSNKQCVTYEKVCDLVNDCGDGSDEMACPNNFYCPMYNEFIPITSKCDGYIDCRGFEDECNPDCRNSKRIIESPTLRIVAWTLGGFAVTLNGVLLENSIRNLMETEMYNAALNHALIALMGLSDMVVGVYLLVLAGTDLFYGDTYCRNR